MTPELFAVGFLVCFSVWFGIGYLLLEMKGVVVSEVQGAIDVVVAQLGKAKEEIVGEIAELEAAVAAGEVPDLSALKAAAQALDDVVVDVQVETPAESVEAPAAE